MKNLIFFTIMLLGCTQASAQQRYGIIAGPNLTTYDNDLSMDVVSLAAGGFFEVGDKIKFMALYSQKGARYGQIDDTKSYKLRMDYLGFYPSYKVLPFLHVGPYVEWGMPWVHAQDQFKKQVRWLQTHWITHRVLAGASADMNIDLDDYMTFGAHYQYGFTSVGKYWWAPLWQKQNTCLLVYLQIAVHHRAKPKLSINP